MSIVVIGGHDRMKKKYQEVGNEFGCKIKVFTYHTPNLEKNIGRPDCIIMFTDVVSHKLINTARKICKKNQVPSLRLHNSSLNSIKSALEQVVTEKKKTTLK